MSIHSTTEVALKVVALERKYDSINIMALGSAADAQCEVRKTDANVTGTQLHIQ
jgi:hypothetical protein